MMEDRLRYDRTRFGLTKSTIHVGKELNTYKPWLRERRRRCMLLPPALGMAAVEEVEVVGRAVFLETRMSIGLRTLVRQQPTH